VGSIPTAGKRTAIIISWPWPLPLYFDVRGKWFFGEQNSDFEPKGVWPVPPRLVTMGRGRKWELPERNVSRKRSQNYSQELWEVTPLLSQTHLSRLEFKNGHISGFCFVFQVIQVVSSRKFSSAEEVDLSFMWWIWIHESDFLEKRPWNFCSIKFLNSGINKSTAQTQSNVIWISSKAELEISFLNSLLEKWVWQSGPKIDLATGGTLDQTDMKYNSWEFVLAMSAIQLFEIFHLFSWSIRSELSKDFPIHSLCLWAFLTQMGRK